MRNQIVDNTPILGKKFNNHEDDQILLAVTWVRNTTYLL